MTELENKSCHCGKVAVQVIGYDDKDQPFRQGWYCPGCRGFDKAIGRERVVK